MSGMSELAKALGDVLAAMDTHHRGASADLRQGVEDAKSEAEKPQPNLLRLRAFLETTKADIQTFATLAPSWDAAQRIARGLGLL
jgi:hypothetical protein